MGIYAAFIPTILYPEIRQIAMRVLTVNVTDVLNMFSFFIYWSYRRLRPSRRRNLGFIPGRDNRISFKAFKPALGLTPASYKCVPAAHSPAVKRLKCEVELHFRG